MKDCILGCKITGQHKTTCEGECRGCLPRPAEVGTLCRWHYNRLEQAVARFAEFAEWLYVVDDDDAHGKPLTDDITHRGDPAEGVPIPASRLEADELTRDLAGWGMVIIEEHPNQPMRGWKAAPWNGNLTGWLLPLLPWAAEQMWADELAGAWVNSVNAARHRWPAADDVEPARTIDVPCPRCGLMSLVYTPPRWQGQAFRVECTDQDCARVFSEDEYERFVGLALRVGHA